MVGTHGGHRRFPRPWWDSWEDGHEAYNPDGKWLSQSKHIQTDAVFRRLHERLWEMGRGETPETCQWDFAGGELDAFEDMLQGMMKFEPAERLTAGQLMKSEYMVKWAMPAWERQVNRKKARA